jgi:hypothetical protein
MVGSAFDALNDLELALDDLAVTSTDLRPERLRMATLRTLGPRLSQMRRRFGPCAASSAGSARRSDGSKGSRPTANATSTAWASRSPGWSTRSTPPQMRRRR